MTEPDPRDNPCGFCCGTGYWTETVEGSDGRDADVDFTCPTCDGTGVEP